MHTNPDIEGPPPDPTSLIRLNDDHDFDIDNTFLSPYPLKGYDDSGKMKYAYSNHFEIDKSRVPREKVPLSRNEALEARTSFLIAEGVKELDKWDEQIKSANASRLTFKDDIKEDSEGNLVKKSKPMRKPSRKESRLRLVAELKKIKEMVDPDDDITPRTVISEFEEYLSNKDHHKSRKELEPLANILSERVLRRHPNNLPLRKSRWEHQDKDDTNSIKSVRFIDQQEEEDEIMKLKTKPKNVDFHQGKVSTTRKPVVRPTPLTTRFNQVQATAPGEPDYWRRRIKQGMVQTEMLMAQLTKQRREDEKYYGVTRTLLARGIGTPNLSFIAQPPLLPPTERAREQLEKNMKDSRKLHEECFGSCTLKTSNKNTEVQESTASVGVGSSVSVQVGLQTKKSSRSTPNTGAKPVVTPNNKNKPTTSGRTSKKGDKNNVDDDRSNSEAIEVIFERSHVTHELVEDEKNQTQQQRPKSPPPPSTPEPHSSSSPRPRPIVILDRTLPKPKDTLSPAKPHKNEWVKRLVEAKHVHHEKEIAAAKQRIHHHKEATSALYKELFKNRTKVEEELHLERQKLAEKWIRNQQMEEDDPPHVQAVATTSRYSKTQKRTPSRRQKLVSGELPSSLKFTGTKKDTPETVTSWLHNVISEKKGRLEEEDRQRSMSMEEDARKYRYHKYKIRKLE